MNTQEDRFHELLIELSKTRTIREIGQLLDVNGSSVSRWINEKRRPHKIMMKSMIETMEKELK